MWLAETANFFTWLLVLSSYDTLVIRRKLCPRGYSNLVENVQYQLCLLDRLLQFISGV